MSDIDALKLRINNVIDDWVTEQQDTNVDAPEPSEEPEDNTPEEEAEPRVLPEGKRVVRTKSSGDRVYLLDEVKGTRQWITNPTVLDGIGFIMEDVKDIDDTEMLKYQMGPALYRVPEVKTNVDA